MPLPFLTFLTFFFLSTPAWAEHQGTNLVNREGQWYFPFHEEPVNGRVLEWFKNGQKSSVVVYKDGKLNGLWTLWYENGQEQEEGTFKDGKFDGVFTVWDTHGNIIKQGTFKNGEAVK